jgi:hypothetical protein
MNRCKNFILSNKDKFQFVLFVGAGIAAFNCLCRPDYNLFLYFFIYFVWFNLNDFKEAQEEGKLNVFYALGFTILFDLIWTLYWGYKWSTIPIDLEKTIHVLVLILSWVAIGYKIFVLICIGLLDWSSIKSGLPKQLREKFNSNYVEQRDEV